MEYIIAILVAALTGSGVSSIVITVLQRHWQKQDKEDNRLDAVVNAEKLIMIDHVKRSAKRFIRSGKISLEEKEHLHEQYDAYKALGGNGHLDTTMNVNLDDVNKYIESDEFKILPRNGIMFINFSILPISGDKRRIDKVEAKDS